MMEAILYSMVGSCVEKLQKIIKDETVIILGLKRELEELQTTIKHVEKFLIDAEKKKTEDLAVKNWLDDLRNAMYCVDDILDLASLEGRKLIAQGSSLASSSSVNSTGCTGFSIFSCLPNIPRRHEIAVRIRNFKAEFEKISERGKFLKLQINMQPTTQVSAAKRKKTSSLVPNLVGEEIFDACRRLVELVLKHKDNKDRYKLGIIGAGGVGKTTLAQKIYNDKKIEETFSKRAWICVSQDYSGVELLKEILRNLKVYQEQGETLAELAVKLAATVEGTSFFLVLDDVWHHEVWMDLLEIPLNKAATVMVLVTTRDDRVAREIQVQHMHRVELMPPRVAWELLWKTMNVSEEKEVEHLRGLGLEIIHKCGWLPLAIKVIARVLAGKEKTENEWRKFINKSAWSIGKLPSELRGALYLSYDELPPCLKRCFLYCALYPEGWTMHLQDLIRYWVAEGFVEDQEGQLLEDTAQDYYYELMDRNLLQSTNSYFDHEICKMHTLFRQLARHLSEDEMFCGEPQSLKAETLTKVPRLSITTEKDAVVLPDVEIKKIRTRTLIINCAKSPIVEPEIFTKLRCIRVLDLTGSLIHDIPSCVGDLIHLRLLDLDGTDISCLPESFGFLVNLQILNLQRCKYLHSLPKAITLLCNLRRLGLKDTPISKVPKGIRSLISLNDLEGFPTGDGSGTTGWSLEELVPLKQLRQLHMAKLRRAAPCSRVQSLLADKNHLKVLHLCWTEQSDKAYSEKDVSNVEKIFEQLTPPCQLEDLAINGFFGRRYPSWLCTGNLDSMNSMKLLECISCVHLPPIGRLLSLKRLIIVGANSVTKIGPEFVGHSVGNLGSPVKFDVAFPKLEVLIIRDMPNWEEWSFVEEEEEAASAAKEGVEDEATSDKQGRTQSPRFRFLPCLKELDLERCPKLRALPPQLGHEATSLQNLIIKKARCLKTVKDFPFLSAALSITGCASLERVSNVPQARELHIHDCPNFRHIDGLDNIQMLCVDREEKPNPPPWALKLLEQRPQSHGDESEADIHVRCL